jgi:hypothetical protein
MLDPLRLAQMPHPLHNLMHMLNQVLPLHLQHQPRNLWHLLKPAVLVSLFHLSSSHSSSSKHQL